jgi:hypothetical protein
METRLRQRLEELRAEYEKGKKTLEDLEAQANSVRATMLRISGGPGAAEELGDAADLKSPAVRRRIDALALETAIVDLLKSALPASSRARAPRPRASSPGLRPARPIRSPTADPRMRSRVAVHVRPALYADAAAPPWPKRAHALGGRRAVALAPRMQPANPA